MNIGTVIMNKRKSLGYTQQVLADKLSVSFQAVSKWENGTDRFRWRSGELFMQYHDWLIHSMNEVVFDCNSGGVPHQHCMDILISEKVMNDE